jgi:chemotaxis protein CheD
MSVQTVGISEIKVSDQPEDILVTYSLGSCIGVAMHDPVAGVGGMIHYMLPTSKNSPDKAKSRPGMFADTGIPLLVKGLFKSGATKKNLIVKVAGGAQLMDPNKIFNIGERNFLMLRKLLWKNNVLIKAQDVGGMLSRTMRLEISTGRVTIKSSEGVTEL